MDDPLEMNKQWRDYTYGHLTIADLEEYIRRQESGYFHRGEEFMNWVHNRIKELQAMKLIDPEGDY